MLLSALAYDIAPTTPVYGSLLTSVEKTAAARFFLRGHTGPINMLAFSPHADRLILASAGEDQTVRLWDLAQRQPLGAPLAGHTAAVRVVAFDPTGAWLASAGNDRQLILWDAAAGALNNKARSSCVAGSAAAWAASLPASPRSACCRAKLPRTPATTAATTATAPTAVMMRLRRRSAPAARV